MDIQVERLTKKYGAQRAVDDISFNVKAGEVLGFLGPNGAGKTTTMKIITTFLNPTAGEVKVGNFSVTANPGKVKKMIGYLPEHNALYEDMPVLDYLKFVAEMHSIIPGKIKDRIYEMVLTCGLEGEKHKKIGELSKGYKQRVGLAQALIHNPEVLILDEPTAGLDPNQIVEIRELIKKIGREKTVILCSHILAEVEATCTRIIIISKGKLVADGTPDDLRKQAQGKEMLRISIEDGDKNEIIQALQHIETIELVDWSRVKADIIDVQSKTDMSSRRAIFQLCKEKGWVLTEMTPVETKLEDIFHELTMN
jgi:ABC-2 type transport system ATP-binding protein